MTTVKTRLNDRSAEAVPYPKSTAVPHTDVASAIEGVAATAAAAATAVQSVNGVSGTAVVIDPDDLDDTATTNKFTTAGDITKLAGIESGATADQTAAEIETAYHAQVAQVSAGEITAGTETAMRRYAPVDIAALATQHAVSAAASIGARRLVRGDNGVKGVQQAAFQMTDPQGRLTLSTGVPVMTSTVSGAATLYYTPYVGNLLWLYDGSTGWDAVTFSERSIALSGGTASRPHDVFVYNNAGTATLELTAWTNDTTRATALTLQDGRYVRTGATTRLYLGTIYVNASNQCDFIVGGIAANGTAGVVGLWNMYHRHRWATFTGDSTDSWSYTTASWRAANNSSTMRTSFVVGLTGDAVDARYLYVSTFSGSTGRNAIGYDSTTAPYDTMGIATSGSAGAMSNVMSTSIRPAVGFHYATALEYGATTVTWYGDLGLTTVQSGLHCTGSY